MKVGEVIDERNDPIAATRAAARKLRENYHLLESWPLALTAYNHGPAGVRRIVTKLGTKDLVEIIQKTDAKRFGFASENFYACFLAALEAEKNAKKYFTNLQWAPELQYEEIVTRKPFRFSHLVGLFDGDKDRADLSV